MSTKQLKSYFVNVPIIVAKEYLAGVPGWTTGTLPGFIAVPRNLLTFVPDIRPSIAQGVSNTAIDAVTQANGWKLRDYQHIGRQFIETRRGTLLADVQRLGKTPQIVASHDPATGQLFVVGPLMTRIVWLTWFRKMWGDKLRIVALKGRTQNMDLIKNADVVFINYDILANWQNTTTPPHTAVFDEAHLLSNAKTKRYSAACLLATQAQKVICASGTPLWNKPANIHSVLNLLEPGGFGTWYEFTKRYGRGMQNEFGYEATGISNEDELKLRLSSLMIRRAWAAVAINLPALTRTVEVGERSVADRIKIDIDLERNRPGFANQLADASRLRGLFALNHKVDVAAKRAIELCKSGEPVVLWIWHKAVASALETVLISNDIPCEVITGETKDKETPLVNWRSWPSGALIISLGVGQAGIDLSHSKHAIFAEIDYTPAVVSQAEMRTFSKDRPSCVSYIVTDHPVEIGIVKSLLKKCKLAERTGLPASDTPMEFLTELIDEEELLLDELNDENGVDDLLTGLLDEAMDDGW